MPELRPIVPADTPALVEVFSRSIWAYLSRNGLLTPEDPPDPPIQTMRDRYGPIFDHLEREASEAWIAVGHAGEPLGYARSIERDGHVELTEFFVDPAAQGGGIGRALLERAFPLGWGRHRSILALLDPRAVSLYLRFGVHAVDTLVDLDGRPERIEGRPDLLAEPVGPGPATEREIVRIERQVLGFDRTPEVRFLLGHRPTWLLRRGNDVVGYAFGAERQPLDAAGEGPHVGPAATLDPADLPAAVDVLIDDAASRGASSLPFSVAVEPGWAHPSPVRARLPDRPVLHPRPRRRADGRLQPLPADQSIVHRVRRV